MDIEYLIFDMVFNYYISLKDKKNEMIKVSLFLGELRQKLISGKYTFTTDTERLIEVPYNEKLKNQCDSVNFMQIFKTIKNNSL